MKRPVLTIILVCFSLMIRPAAAADTYDGLWFLGFNMNKEVFSGNKSKLVRQAFNHAINRSYICKDVIGDNNVPSGVIPMGMPGHLDNRSGYSFSTSRAKKLLRSAGLKEGDKRLKNLMLIHTDGQKTAKIARIIKKELTDSGIQVTLKEIAYEEDDSWERELTKGSADLFLMGYKVPPQPFEKNDPVSRSEKFLYELFHSKGEANMFFLHNKDLDALIETTGTVPSKEAGLKTRLLQKADGLLFEDPVTVNLFYIEEL